MDVSDIRTSDFEPIRQAMQRAPYDDTAEHPNVVDINQAQRQAASAPQLPFWLAEKYFWKQANSANGVRFYLSPLPTFLRYVEEKAERAKDYGMTVIFPGNAEGSPEGQETDEQEQVKLLAQDLKSTLETLRAISDNEASDFLRWATGRATRNAVYAATTQFELQNWAARASAQGNDARDHENFGVKEERMLSFATTAAVVHAALVLVGHDDEDVRRVLPKAQDFAKAARSIVYQQADIQSRQLQNPAQLDEQQRAVSDAAKLQVNHF